MISLSDKKTRMTLEHKEDRQLWLERVRNGRSRKCEMRREREAAPDHVGTWLKT